MDSLWHYKFILRANSSCFIFIYLFFFTEGNKEIHLETEKAFCLFFNWNRDGYFFPGKFMIGFPTK